MEINIDAVKEVPAEAEQDIGLTLGEIRRKKRITLTDIAKETGLSYSMVSTFMNGNVHGSMNTINKICEAMGVRLILTFEDVQ